MTEVPQPRNAATQDRPPTRLLQVRARLTCSVRPDERPSLMLVSELYERREAQWARLTNRSYPVSLEDALHGEGYLQAVAELASFFPSAAEELRLDTERPRP